MRICEDHIHTVSGIHPVNCQFWKLFLCHAVQTLDQSFDFFSFPKWASWSCRIQSCRFDRHYWHPIFRRQNLLLSLISSFISYGLYYHTNMTHCQFKVGRLFKMAGNLLTGYHRSYEICHILYMLWYISYVAFDITNCIDDANLLDALVVSSEHSKILWIQPWL